MAGILFLKAYSTPQALSSTSAYPADVLSLVLECGLNDRVLQSNFIPSPPSLLGAGINVVGAVNSQPREGCSVRPHHSSCANSPSRSTPLHSSPPPLPPFVLLSLPSAAIPSARMIVFSI